jgi:group I intron endonuclease
MEYIIYYIENKINKKIYIGYTSKTINKRFDEHIKNAKNKVNRRLYDAMNHYGYDNFIIKEIEICDDKFTANELESWYIYIFQSKNPDKGYNMTWGGDGGNTIIEWSDESKQILYKKQQESREKTFLKKYGVKSPTKLDFIKEKISNSHKGKKLSQIHKKRISDTVKKNILLGNFIPSIINLRPRIKGEFKHTEETKKKISKHRLGKKYEDIFDNETIKILKTNLSNRFLGDKNPNYKPSLSNDESIKFIELLINNKNMSQCSYELKHSEYKLRQYLRSIGVENIQKLKRTDKDNIFLKNILTTI